MTALAAPARSAQIQRKTNETDISLRFNLDGAGQTDINTGIGFLDHLLTALAFHARFDLELGCTGDLHIDDHHTAEDCALALGSAMDQALGARAGIRRFADSHAPLDEALARAVVDFSGRPHAEVRLDLQRDTVGALACENIEHVLRSLAINSRTTLHVDVLRGENDHHKAEAAFKAAALAFRAAVARDGSSITPSTKGALCAAHPPTPWLCARARPMSLRSSPASSGSG